MPIGYLITTGGLAMAAAAAVVGYTPRRSSPFRIRHIFGLWLNWPLVTFFILLGSTALAFDQSDVDTVGLWIGLAFSAATAVALTVLRRRARHTCPIVTRALDEALGTTWRDQVDARLARRLGRRPSLAGVLVAPIDVRRRVVRIANIRYGPARRGNRLDLYRSRRERPAGPTLVYFHGRFGNKRLGGRHLLARLAANGWVCISANYRSSESLVDVERVIAWVGEHGHEYGADSNELFLAGSSFGGHLASLAAFDHGDAAAHDVTGVISLYGYYGLVAPGGPSESRLVYATAAAPPCFVAHGDQDNLVTVEDARTFVEQLRATSANPVVYVELPGVQHGFDLFRSRRFDTIVDAIEAFTATVRRSAAPSTS